MLEFVFQIYNLLLDDQVSAGVPLENFNCSLPSQYLESTLGLDLDRRQLLSAQVRERTVPLLARLLVEHLVDDLSGAAREVDDE